MITSALALYALAVSATVAQEQAAESEPPRAAEIELTVGSETTYPLDPSHPLVLYVDRQLTTNDGVWIEPRVFLRTEDGFVALTPCDDLVIPCKTVPVRATGPLADVPQGTSFKIADEWSYVALSATRPARSGPASPSGSRSQTRRPSRCQSRRNRARSSPA
jgi:hypothetical protein